MSAPRIVPRCRICGAKVPAFGDYCAADEPTEEATDSLAAIVAADLAKLGSRYES